MENKKRFSLLKVIITVICILFIVASLAVNILFSGNKIPNFFGRYFYVVDSNSVGEGVTPSALILAKEKSDKPAANGDIVLCYPDETDQLQLRGICDIVETEDGQRKYAIGIGSTAVVDENGDRVTITDDKIAAVCTGSTQSLELGRFIQFTLNIKGILLELILPCVILVIFLIVKIASSSNKEDENEEDYNFYEYEEGDDENMYAPPSHEKQNGPLFEPAQEIQPSGEFERKKMSIAENFAQKEVDHNSSYQKEKERTQQFKAQKNISAAAESPSANYRARHQSSAESNFAARNIGGQSSTASTASALREEMLRKTAEAERGGAYNTKLYGNNESASDMTGVYSKSQLAEMARNESSYSAPRRKPAVSHERKSSSPDIGDIISRSETDAKKKNASDMSVDDLLKMIENEKRKL